MKEEATCFFFSTHRHGLSFRCVSTTRTGLSKDDGPASEHLESVIGNMFQRKSVEDLYHVIT